MEEDIKIQDLIEHIRFGTQLKYDMKTYLIAIENLIARYKELEKQLNLEIKGRSLLLTCLENNYIKKSKVQEKIKELEAMSISKDIYYDDVLKLLQELLE